MHQHDAINREGELLDRRFGLIHDMAIASAEEEQEADALR